MYAQSLPIFDDKYIRKHNITVVTGFTFQLKDGLPVSYGWKSFYQQYKNGVVIQSESYNAAHKLTRKASFDQEGRITEELFYNDDQSLNYKIEYQYASNGFLQEKKMFLGDNSFWLKYTIAVDASGRIIKETTSDKNEKVQQESNFFYDENNNLERIEKGAGGTQEYSYDKQGCLHAVQVFAPSLSRMGDKYFYFYDEDLLLRQVYHNNDEMTLFDYTH